MTQDAFDRGDWQTVLDAHRLESCDAAELLRYGSALLQPIEPGPGAGKQQQQQLGGAGVCAGPASGGQRRSDGRCQAAGAGVGGGAWPGGTRARCAPASGAAGAGHAPLRHFSFGGTALPAGLSSAPEP